MMRLAKARNNGGVYFEAKSRRSPADLERLYRQREVAVVLEEATGGILGGEGVTPRGTIYVQIHRDYLNPRTLDDVRLCLEELGVELIKPLPVQNMV